MRAAASRTFWTAGRSRPMRMAMIAITTNSSISVKAPRIERLDMGTTPWSKNYADDTTINQRESRPRASRAQERQSSSLHELSSATGEKGSSRICEQVWQHPFLRCCRELVIRTLLTQLREYRVGSFCLFLEIGC